MRDNTWPELDGHNASAYEPVTQLCRCCGQRFTEDKDTNAVKASVCFSCWGLCAGSSTCQRPGDGNPQHGAQREQGALLL